MQSNTERTYQTSNGTPLTVSRGDRAEDRFKNFRALVNELPKKRGLWAVDGFERDRSTSWKQFTKAEGEVLALSKPAAALRYISRELQLACQHIVAPADPLEAIDEKLDAETDIQAQTDKAQRRLKDFIRTRDIVGIDRVVEWCAQHEVALHDLRQCATTHRNIIAAGVRA